MKLLAVLLAFAVAAHARDYVSANDQARYLAGLPVPESSPLAAYTKHPAWQQHAAEMDAAWAKCERQSLSKTRSWAGKFVKSSGSSAPCYYMFSGPDILYAHTIYPNASAYVLCGIEPVGGVPDLMKTSPDRAAAGLGSLRRSLNNVLRFSYFITKDMKVDLGGSELSGTVPILYFFLARMGCDITNVSNTNAGGAPGVRIDFRSGFGTQTVYYFRGDLSNGGSGAGVMSYCRKLGPNGLGLLKAASYLLHEGSFSSCREFLLSNCRVLVQDDSGIPHRNFTPQRWQLRYFGSYAGTTGGPFAKYYQPDLAAAYGSVSPVAIDFQLSYQWDRAKANLVVATRTAAPAPPPTPKPIVKAAPKPAAKPVKKSAKPAAQNPFTKLFGPKATPTPPAKSAKKSRRKTS
ncbi:MAG: hypothetical protein ABMA13_03360 [Chthoniobacteraceae bacterium]